MKSSSTVRFMSLPQTEPPPTFAAAIVGVFQSKEVLISTVALEKGLTSDDVLTTVGSELQALGFQIELGKTRGKRIDRPVFYGENGVPEQRYLIDAYHPIWRCGLEVEAGRAWMGNAVYRDIVQALVMVDVDHLVIAIPNRYKFKNASKDVFSSDYDNTISVARALYGHRRMVMPYGLTVIGY